ncbi:hypothetical protein [Aequorivita capsosiphonis]|uniref:hypothetical protein n=1 Tax=Aequorivita capsosiphonis TaxID=487317 RepID=UPI000411356A|nr:hypothetical protein [Aequorivita capsosiphonis]
MKKFVIALCFIFLIATVIVLRPVPIVHEADAVTERGVVTAVYDGGGSDIVFKLKNNERTFYINRGLQAGIELNELRESLIGNEITLKYPKYWTPLDWENKIKHLSKVEFENIIVFNEFKE